jgi:hypothetical protein
VSGESLPKPPLKETLYYLRREVWSVPVLYQRSDDEILGYNVHGRFD